MTPGDTNSVENPDVVVLRRTINDFSAAEYADILRERLPDQTVAHARTPDQERELLRKASVATGFAIDEAHLAIADELDLFACILAGTGHLALDAFESHGVAVTNASGVATPSVAEHVVGSVLAFARQFHVARRRAERAVWQSYPTRELKGSTVLVLGLGAIGSAVVERLEPFGVETIGVRYTPEKGGPTDEVVGFDDREGVHDALSRSQYVVVACPLTDVTEGLIDVEAFRTMPPEAVLVNVGRGPVVDTDALVEALRGNLIRGAALDVADPEPLPGEHPLWNLENVLITPHNAGYTPKYWERMAEIVTENVARLDDGRDDLRNRVV